VSCLTCKHARFVPPSDWHGKKWEYSHHLALREVERTGHAQLLDCTLNPDWSRRNTNHTCGQWAAVETETDLLYLRQARDNRIYHAMAEEVKDLRRQLTEARRRSANRMLRIKALKGRAASPLDAMNAIDHIPAAQDP
jgi:hypothetical protein